MTFTNEERYWYNSEMIRDITTGVKSKFYSVIILCSCFILLESLGAYYSHSIAIFTDVAHLISDLIGFIFSLVSVYMAAKSTTLDYTYGFVRAEILGALFSLVLIWGLTIWIIVEAVSRIVNKTYIQINPLIMLITAIGALIVNIIMWYFLHHSSVPGGCGHHHHGHDHEEGEEQHRRESLFKLPQEETL